MLSTLRFQGKSRDGCWQFHFPGQSLALLPEEESRRQMCRDSWLSSDDHLQVINENDMQFIERKKWVIKRHGESISSSAIEQSFRCRLPELSEIVVVGWSDATRPHLDMLVVFIQGKPNFSLHEKSKVHASICLASISLISFLQSTISPAIPWERLKSNKLFT
ncbi:MAG: hypothetical protein ACOH5I_24090 [Oligoflexus sp.]